MKTEFFCFKIHTFKSIGIMLFGANKLHSDQIEEKCFSLKIVNPNILEQI